MPILFDIDSEQGITEYWDYDPINDTFAIITQQDVTGFLDATKEARNNPELTAKGIKEDWWHYASVPAVVELELKKKGLDLYNKDHIKAILKEINTNYPLLKVTDKNHR